MSDTQQIPEWSADITNDPDRDYDLCIEIWEGDDSRGRIERDDRGALILRVYVADTRIPAEWLAALLARASKDLP